MKVVSLSKHPNRNTQNSLLGSTLLSSSDSAVGSLATDAIWDDQMDEHLWSAKSERQERLSSITVPVVVEVAKDEASG